MHPDTCALGLFAQRAGQSSGAALKCCGSVLKLC